MSTTALHKFVQPSCTTNIFRKTSRDSGYTHHTRHIQTGLFHSPHCHPFKGLGWGLRWWWGDFYFAAQFGLLLVAVVSEVHCLLSALHLDVLVLRLSTAPRTSFPTCSDLLKGP